MLSVACASLRSRWAENPWVQALCDQAERVMRSHTHGDLTRWFNALQALPRVPCRMNADLPAPKLGAKAADPETLRENLMAFHPWRKGPLELAGVSIDTEWRSDWKWERVRDHIDLRGQRVLDIGCGNGYFGWRMLAAGARLVVGIDPTLVYVMQWLACRHFAGDEPNYVLPLNVDELPAGSPAFDVVCSMGVLYHRRDPMQHLQQIHALLKPGGILVLESLVLPNGAQVPLLIPQPRYARMRNVWSIPSCEELLRWVRESGYAAEKLVDVSRTTVQEQRSTEWMQFESLAQALDPKDAGRTLEGYPAPTRALLIAKR
jgi:tRNA (mo5U34)-methyltransferase